MKCAIRSQLMAYKSSEFFLLEREKLKIGYFDLNFKKWSYILLSRIDQMGPFDRLRHNTQLIRRY